MSITCKPRIRYYAPYRSAKGNWCQKGFGSKMAAARFLAKQAMYDMVFGEKYEHFQDIDGQYQYFWWSRDTPDTKDGRKEKFAEAFPCETCECPTNYRDDNYTDYCETAGFAYCQMKKWLDSTAQDFYYGRKTYGPQSEEVTP